jgi:glutamate/tyrosine decarboxylase-like PLP-dependent enzyme
MDEFRRTLCQTADRIASYREDLGSIPVTSALSRDGVAERLDSMLADAPTSLPAVIEELVAAAEPGLMASAGPRYFGFVMGGVLDAALVADLLAAAWDQNAFNAVTSPAALAFEDVAGRWLKQILHIPDSASVGFVTGAQAANTVGLAAARCCVLSQYGWDVGRDGLYNAPQIRILAGAERHATIDRALRLLGLGEGSIQEIPAMANGAMDPDALAAAIASGPQQPTIICAQSGNVNTGACDDLKTIAPTARGANAWLHVDGAFGLWAAASQQTYPLVEGIELAHSWACDGHKWLNVPYDTGYVFCAYPKVHATAMAYSAAYLTGQEDGRRLGGGDFVLESSRRARGFATWAALRSLGCSGVAALVEHCSNLAARFAEGLEAINGVEVVNDVVLNQVLVRVGDEETTEQVERRVQLEGVCWLGATTWRGERLLRISVSNWSTTESDVDICVAAIARAREAAIEMAASHPPG